MTAEIPVRRLPFWTNVKIRVLLLDRVHVYAWWIGIIMLVPGALMVCGVNPGFAVAIYLGLLAGFLVVWDAIERWAQRD